MGSCLESTVSSSRTVHTERTFNIHKVVAEQVVKKDLVAYQVSSNWYVQCLIMPMGDNEEALDDFITVNLIQRPKLLLEHIAQNQQTIGQLQVDLLQKFHHFMMGQLLGSSMKSSLKIGRILQCSKQANEDQH